MQGANSIISSQCYLSIFYVVGISTLGAEPSVENPTLRKANLLYLMVLIDSHTISKGIDNDDKVNSNIDYINEVDRPTHPKSRRDKFQHKRKLYYNKDEDVALTDGLKDSKLYTKPTDKITSKTTPKTTTELKAHKSPKRRIGSFWRRLQGKDKNKQYKNDDRERKKRIPHNKKEQQKRENGTRHEFRNPDLRAKGKKKNRKKLYLRQPEAKITKRDVIGQYLLQNRPTQSTTRLQKVRTSIAIKIDHFLKFPHKELKLAPLPDQALKSSILNDDLSAQLDTISFNISNLKARYGLLRNLPQCVDPFSYENTESYQISTTPAYLGTALIEDMLDDIKSKASHVGYFERPLVTNMINSAVTFATFDAYPMLRRISMPSSTGYNFMYRRMSREQPSHSDLTTFMLPELNVNDEKTAISTESILFDFDDPKFSAITESHNLAARSIKEDTMTIAQNVEDLLQRELKNLYNKVKHKVSKDFRKEIQEAKSTVKKLTSKKTPKQSLTTIPHRTHPCPCKTTITKKKNKPAITSPRIKKKDDREDSKTVEDTSPPYAKRTYDDYMMLTLYEQMLARTHEDNVRRMLATTEFPIFPKTKREAIRLSKRNPETLTNVKLREVVQDMYDDGGNMPEYDYVDPLANVSSTIKAVGNNNYNEKDYDNIDYVIEPPTTPEIRDDSLGITKSKVPELHFMDADGAETILNNTLAGFGNNTPTDTNLVGLSNKISYNEFVNGYRHYLKFQKELKKQNFSNLVKYQAHRHHSVDDIGKYILNKIPQLPLSFDDTERFKRFSDDSENNNMDYQEITTKSDDSWFRKHFYFFLDNGPPKKFHSSQTVELKSPMEHKLFITESTSKQTPMKEVKIGSLSLARKVKESPDICLDDLTKMLNSVQDKTAATNSVSEDGIKAQTSAFNFNIGSDPSIQSKSFISKLFSGKRRRDNKKETLSTFYLPATGDMFAGTTPGKLKRSATKEEVKNSAVTEFINKDIEEKVTTFSPTHLKEVFADAPQGSTRETNKYGYVDIDLVPRQTAVVNLRDNAKKSRIKNFFKKFHFKKKKKKTPKPKRACYYGDFVQNGRKARFDPIKKLKSMFFTSDKKEKETTSGSFHISDYGVVNPVGDFKHMKFANVMSVDEMKKQIPNISEVYFGPPTTSTTINPKVSSDAFRLDKSDHDLLYNFDIKSSAVTTKSTSKLAKPKTTTRTTKIPHPSLFAHTISSDSISTKETSTHTTRTTPKTNLLRVNVKTLVPERTTSTLVMTYDQVNIGRKKLHNPAKKATDTISKISTTFGPNDQISRDNIKFENQIRVTVTPQINNERVAVKCKVATVSLSPQTIDDRLVVKSKLTRIAKFPIKASKLKKRRNDRPGPGDSNHGGESLLEYLLDLKNTHSPTAIRKLVEKKQGIHSSTIPITQSDKENGYTDYFNDLVMWHNDILNLDTVPNPSWQKVVKALEQAQGQSYTPPNMARLLIELNEIKDHLSEAVTLKNATLTALYSNKDALYSRSKDEIRRYVNKFYDRPEIRSVAMDDHAVVTSKNMIIKGEAKYFQYNNPKRLKKLRSSDFVTKLDNLTVFKRKYRGSLKRKGRHRHSIRPSKNHSESPILLDTTLMAYDDEVDSITKSLKSGKMSMVLQKIRKSAPSTKKTTDHPTLLKTNKAPEQHYATPLPMESRDFNEFLKQNSMDVDYLTSPILEMPTIPSSWPLINASVKSSNSTSTTSTSLSTITQETTSKSTTKLTQKPQTKRKQSTFSKQLSKITKALSTHVGGIFKEKNSKKAYWDNDFDRYKRYTELSKQPNVAYDKQRTTSPQEVNYYNILRKKVKEKFEKKETAPAEKASLADPLDKDVEITIINFDDIEKITTHQGYSTYYFPQDKKNDFGPFTDISEMSTESHRPIVSSSKEEMHNKLLYKNAFKGRTTSTTAATEYTAVDLTQSTEYVDPMLNDPMVTEAHNRAKFPFDKIVPAYPNIFNKPQQSDTPKRVHISSHHYKYDIFYDDRQRKKANKNGVKSDPFSVDQPLLKNGTLIEAKFTKETPMAHRLLPTIFRKGTKAEAIRKNHKNTHMNRHRRKAKMPDVTKKKRKYFTFRGCKPKPNGGLLDPGWHLESASLNRVLGNISEVPVTVNYDLTLPKLENSTSMPDTQPITSASDNSTESQTKGAKSDGEDLVTTYDKEGTESTTEDAETKSSVESQFFSTIIIRNTESVRKATPSPAHHCKTSSGFLVLKKLKLNNQTKRADNQSLLDEERVKGVDQNGPLSKISARIQNTLRHLMKNMPTPISFTNQTSRHTEGITKRNLKHWNIIMPGPNKATKGQAATAHYRKPAKDNYPGLTESAPRYKTTNAVEAPRSNTTDREEDVYEKEDEKGEGIRFVYTSHPTNESMDLNSVGTDTTLPLYMDTQKDEEAALKPFCHSSSHHGYKPVKVKGKVIHHELANDIFVFGPSYASKQVYSLPSFPPTTTTTTSAAEDYQFDFDHDDVKRVARQLNTFTAKDVAALEVVVDLMKNTLSYEDKDIAFIHNHSNAFASKALHANGSTNSIQVHIAIPFDFQTGKKRSAAGSMEPVRVRKVFSAKMSSPVDLEYQVHSYEGTMQSTSATESIMCNFTVDDSSLTPGMYLLIDKPKSGLALRPVVGPISMTDFNTRQDRESTASMPESTPLQTRIETTSLKIMPKVTLSKDFISVVNQKLIEMYENQSRIHDIKIKKRSARSIWRTRKLKRHEIKKTDDKHIDKRRIDWDTVKKYFGHDRVCSCKCKSNKTMCKACAASNAVIDELIFEFDNIGKYMTDHCTEIQTFFWMNPIAGQKLRDSVNKIDKSLTAYYKRVKGKCQGRLCETFGTCVDKRHFTKTTKTEKEDIMANLMKDLTILAEDLNKTVSLKACYNNKIKEKGDEFLNTVGRCITNKTFGKRSNPYTTSKKMIKNVYSLDNINVNIICNPESETKPDLQTLSATLSSFKANSQELYDHLVDYELQKVKQKRKRLGLKSLFPGKRKTTKIFTYLDFGSSTRCNYKRQVNNQVEIPLISDGGGGFWYDYIKSATIEPRMPRNSDKDKSNIQIAIVPNKPEEATDGLNFNVSTPRNDAITNMNITVQMTSAVKQNEVETTTADAWSSSVNRLLWLLGSLPDVEAMNKNSNRSVMFLNNVTKSNKEQTPNLTDYKVSDVKPLVAQDKYKINKASLKKAPASTTTTTLTTTPSTTLTTRLTSTRTLYKSVSLDEQLQELTTIEQTLENPTLVPYKKHNYDTTLDKETVESVMGITTSKKPGETTLKSTKLVLPLPDSSTKKVPSSKTTTETSFTSVHTTDTITSSTLTSTDSADITTTSSSQRTLISIIDNVSLSTQLLENESTRKSTSLINKLKSATMKLFENNDTPNTKTTIILDASMLEDDEMSPDKENDFKTTKTSSMNPTIVILHEYDSPPDAMNEEVMPDYSREGYKSLLLSIIQFETNSLNDEWDQVAYGGGRHKMATHMRRSVDMSPIIDTSTMPTQPLLPSSLLMPAEEELKGKKKTTSKPESLLNKIVNKIGIKIVPTKKKVAIKQNIRDVKRAEDGILKHSMLQVIMDHKTTLPCPPEACDSRPKIKPRHLCDIQATFSHIKSLQASLPPKAFEKFVRNISCYKYKDQGTNFFVIPYPRQAKRWDWIRSKRSLKRHVYRNKANNEDDVSFDDLSVESFERFVKGDGGIYKIINRRKRTAKMEALDRGLRNIPPLIPGENERYVMIGDSVTLDCGLSSPVRTCDGKFRWRTDREGMLEHDNVDINGISLTIHNLQPRNVGRYTCSLDHTVRKNIKLNVLAIPSFDIVFLPVYKTGRDCSYDDLRAIQRLDSLMANETHCGEACTVRIDEPVCLRDKLNGSLIRATAVISMAAGGVNCSYQCKRDIVASLVLLCAANTAFLSSIGVLMSSRGGNQTLTPWKNLTRPVVTHTLRKKDTNGHHEYHKLVSALSPGRVDVVVICPAGYYLLPSYKLCSSCPPNTASKAGENKCRLCPRGTRAEPGAAYCRPDNGQPRRYDWWWYPPGGYLVACCGVMFGCMACVILGMVVHVLSRDPDQRKDEDCRVYERKTPKPVMSMTVAYAHIAQTRPLSPSRVILPRFFRPSLTSSRATDSQETKFGLWKEKNIPPPLPPIDFDP